MKVQVVRFRRYSISRLRFLAACAVVAALAAGCHIVFDRCAAYPWGVECPPEDVPGKQPGPVGEGIPGSPGEPDPAGPGGRPDEPFTPPAPTDPTDPAAPTPPGPTEPPPVSPPPDPPAPPPPTQPGSDPPPEFHGTPVTGATECDIPLDSPGWTVWHDHGTGCHRHSPGLHPHSPPVVVVQPPPATDPPATDPPDNTPPEEPEPEPDPGPTTEPPPTEPEQPPPIVITPPDPEPISCTVAPAVDGNCTHHSTWVLSHTGAVGCICGCWRNGDDSGPMTIQRSSDGGFVCGS